MVLMLPFQDKPLNLPDAWMTPRKRFGDMLRFRLGHNRLPVGGILIESVTKASMDIAVSRKWVTFQFGANYPFNQKAHYARAARKPDLRYLPKICVFI